MVLVVWAGRFREWARWVRGGLVGWVVGSGRVSGGGIVRWVILFDGWRVLVVDFAGSDGGGLVRVRWEACIWVRSPLALLRTRIVTFSVVLRV